MRLLLLSLFLIFSWATTNAQTTIQMEQENGVYKIPCLVNGAKMKMIFDTGASNVNISMAIAEYLFENDFISKSDIIGIGKSQIADGSIVNNAIINIRDLKIGDFHLSNVKATVSNSLSAPLLLGQSAIQKLGSITIEDSKLIINQIGSKYPTLSSDQLLELREKIASYSKYNMHAAEEEAYDQLYAAKQISKYELFKYATVCFLNENSEKALRLLNEIQDVDRFVEQNGINLFYWYGRIFTSLKRYKDAYSYFEKSLIYLDKRMKEETADSTDTFEPIFTAYAMACQENKEYAKAANNYSLALTTRSMDLGIDKDYTFRLLGCNPDTKQIYSPSKIIKDDQMLWLDFQFHLMMFISEKLTSKEFDSYLLLSAYLGKNPYSADYLDSVNKFWQSEAKELVKTNGFHN